MTEPRDEARDVLAKVLHKLEMVRTPGHHAEIGCTGPKSHLDSGTVAAVLIALAARGYRLTTEPAPDVEAHPETYCHRCGGPNLWSWSAPSPLWNAVMRDPSNEQERHGWSIVCPQCFAELAAEMGVIQEDRTRWRVYPDSGVMVELATTFDGGLVWDAERWLWVEPAALHPADPSQTPEVETWLAIRAALHEAANDKCRDGRFDHCYEQFHSPPVQFADWWPPADPSRREP